ncbi:MAG: hypothetical protein Q4A82_01965 [Corynebacterium sp.]|nr:hypothetical protein [Corynebacterium sp.]
MAYIKFVMIVLRTSTKSFCQSRTVTLAVFFIAMMCGFAALLGLLLIDARGWWRVIVLISLTVPVVGVVLSIWGMISNFRRLRRPVLIINNDEVHIVETGIRFPTNQLQLGYLFHHGMKLFGTLIPTHLITDEDAEKYYSDYTFTFPRGATLSPTQFTDALYHRGVRVIWKD